VRKVLADRMPGSSPKEIADLGKLFTGKHAQNMKSVRLKVRTKKELEHTVFRPVFVFFYSGTDTGIVQNVVGLRRIQLPFIL
jgi:hypothetical protein